MDYDTPSRFLAHNHPTSLDYTNEGFQGQLKHSHGHVGGLVEHNHGHTGHKLAGHKHGRVEGNLVLHIAGIQ